MMMVAVESGEMGGTGKGLCTDVHLFFISDPRLQKVVFKENDTGVRPPFALLTLLELCGHFGRPI